LFNELNLFFLYRDREKAVVVLEEKLNELEANLSQMNQRVSIPDINLIPHASIGQAIRQCQEKNQRPNVDLFREKVEDSNFLNQLQATVNRWIREIQKVGNIFY
jgi:hypothetical protein